MSRFIKTMAYTALATTLTFVSTQAVFADGKGGHSGGQSRASFSSQHVNVNKQQNLVLSQNHNVQAHNQVNNHNFNQNNFSQKFKTDVSQKGFAKGEHNYNPSNMKTMPYKKSDFCWDKSYCWNFGCYPKGCWNYGWCGNYNWCYPYCNSYPWFSFYYPCWRPYCYTLGYATSPVFCTTEVITTEAIVPQVAVAEVPVATEVTQTTKKTVSDVLETPPAADTSFIASFLGQK